MPVVNCPSCSWAHPSLIAHCLHCNDTRHVLVASDPNLPPAMRGRVDEPTPRLPATERLLMEPMPAVNAAFLQMAQDAKEECMRITGIRELPRDPIGDALRQLERAMRITGTVVTITTRAAPDMPLRAGCYDLCVETRERNLKAPFPRLLVELTLPSN